MKNYRLNNSICCFKVGLTYELLVEGLALRIHNDSLARKQEQPDPGELVPDLLSGAEIYMLDMGTLVAGTKYHSDFEKWQFVIAEYDSCFSEDLGRDQERSKYVFSGSRAEMTKPGATKKK